MVPAIESMVIPFMTIVFTAIMVLNQLFVHVSGWTRTTIKSRFANWIDLSLTLLGFMVWGIWVIKSIVYIVAWNIGGNMLRL